MRGLEVFINGEKVCTAGMDEFGLLSAMITWLQQSPDASHEPNKRSIELDVGAFVSAPEEAKEHLRWVKRSLQVGDTIEIRITEVKAVDEPTERRPDNPEIVESALR